MGKENARGKKQKKVKSNTFYWIAGILGIALIITMIIVSSSSNRAHPTQHAVEKESSLKQVTNNGPQSNVTYDESVVGLVSTMTDMLMWFIPLLVGMTIIAQILRFVRFSGLS